ncbi:MAG: ABC transporter ATP-binding protein [Lachnospiraceae bacterium]|nr:ABC transporter ATP-binding protein [Lachnospiraceae bacterium]
METAIEIRGLNKSFGKRHVLKDVNLTTYAGEVFGFLGPNGAGKSTTIKMIVGLLSIDEGQISICGNDVEKNFEDAMKLVGAIVENPESYKNLTGLQNLQLYARIRKGVTPERVQEVIELVGLSNRIKEKVGKYSLGMKQRLGLAQALLHHPKVLILDEPTNGLDPAGIKTLRDILKKLAHEEGVCVLVSSHMMSEMELMCDRVGIIMNGAMVDVKTIDELVASAASDTLTFHYYVDRAEEAFKTVSEYDETISGHVMDETHFEISYPSDKTDRFSGELNRKLFESGYSIYSITPVTNKHLEDVFLQMTQEGGSQIA